MGIKCPKCQFDNPDTQRFCGECGTQIIPAKESSVSPTKTLVTPTEELNTGSTFAGRYQIIEELGRGGMGVVYKAQDSKLKRTVALKFLPPELTLISEVKERFMREAQAAAALDHPNICTVHEIDEAEGKTFISMAFVDGESLKEKVKSGPLKLDEALNTAIQVAEGLEEAHKKGIVHRDIKSANIMATEKGQVKIMDFGLAKVSGGTLVTREGTTMGTVAYMSPEQTRGEEVDHRSDIWSLSVVLYEMLSGQLPFKGDREASILYSVVHEEPKSLKDIKPDVPVELVKIINQALKKKRESRYQSAAEMLKDLKQYQAKLRAAEAGVFNLQSLLRRIRQPRVAIPAILLILVLCFVAVWFFNRRAKIKWARDVALPEIQRLIDQYAMTDVASAFELAQEAEKYIAGDAKFAELLSKCSVNISIQTQPPGASIYMKEYSSFDDDWEFLGTSPIDGIRVPRGFMRWKIEKPGYEPVEAADFTFDYHPTKGWIPKNLVRVLDPEGAIPPGMVRTRGGDSAVGKLPDFFFDKYEVTNKQFKEFSDSGGYQKKEYWKHEFVKDGKTLAWEEAMSMFIDTTGRPGPAEWQAGDYPEGQDDYPVSGVSWYEAAAYAEFVHKSLPTIYHLDIALVKDVLYNLDCLPSILSFISNFNDRPVPVGSSQSLSFFGSYDLTGNVREWCWNESPGGRCIRGGAWGDVAYMMSNITQASTFDRSPQNGFRCVRHLEPGKIPEDAFEPYEITADTRDYYKEKPVSDEVFQIYKDQFSYDKAELNSKVEEVDQTPKDWIKERVSFNAAYGNERVIVNLYLPRKDTQPFQTVIFFPGSMALLEKSSKDVWYEEDNIFDFIIKNGRAVMYPVYKGTYERRDEHSFRIHTQKESRQYVERLIKVVKDFKRCIDYLETRTDIDSKKLAYYGYSWGGELANIILAVEERLKVSIVHLGGLMVSGFGKINPAGDPFNYVTRVKIPTLMLNGKYDISFQYEATVKPMYDLLGTPHKDKKLILCESDHHIPKNVLIKETLNWLDRYLGRIK